MTIENPNQITKENKMESKEKLSVFIAYRENDLFNMYMPEIIETLRQMGKVETKIFSRETEREEIKKWVSENRELLENSNYISDGTCEIKFESGQLDGIFKNATELATFGSKIEAKNSKDVEKTGIVFQHLIKKITEKKKPKHIIIAPTKLISHQPFTRKGIKEEEKNNADIESANAIKKWLMDVGYSEENISIGYSAERDDLSENWVIYDRHNFMGDFAPKTGYLPEKALTLPMPIESLYADCLEKGLIEKNQSEEKFKESLMEILKEKISA